MGRPKTQEIDTRLRYRERYEGELGPSEVEEIAQLLFSWWRREFEETRDGSVQRTKRSIPNARSKPSDST
jgi:hypothetical protein